jgi:hypothetical protein
MGTQQLMAEYDKAKDLSSYPSLRGLTREQIADASDKYEAMMAGKKCKPKGKGKGKGYGK